MFENHSKIIIGLERLMLEASGFDFRNRSPQRLVLKLAKHYDLDKKTVGRTAFNISLDLYRTFAPLKQTTPTMAIACVELSGRLHQQNMHELESGDGYQRWMVTRPEIMGNLYVFQCSVTMLMIPKQRRFSTYWTYTPISGDLQLLVQNMRLRHS